jgi:hypothetical protein
LTISIAQSRVQNSQRLLVELEKKVATVSKKEADCSSKLSQVLNRRTTTNSDTLARIRDVSRINEESSKLGKERSELLKQIADKTKELHRAQESLRQEEERDRRRVTEFERKRLNEQKAQSTRLRRELAIQRVQPIEVRFSESESQHVIPVTKAEFDFFISHASEDKLDFVRPLADALEALGCDVWYDETQLRVGDSLNRAINKGLTRSRYGIVVLSHSFFSKNWTQYELGGLIAKQMTGSKVVLPIWHKISKDEVAKNAPALVDIVALQSSLMTIVEIARELADVAGVSTKPSA